MWPVSRRESPNCERRVRNLQLGNGMFVHRILTSFRLCSHARCRRPPKKAMAKTRRYLPLLRGQRRCHCQPQGRDEGKCYHRTSCQGVCRSLAPNCECLLHARTVHTMLIQRSPSISGIQLQHRRLSLALSPVVYHDVIPSRGLARGILNTHTHI